VSDNTGHATYTYDRTIAPRGVLISMTDSIGPSTQRLPPWSRVDMRSPVKQYEHALMNVRS
jgi:hypothetical protein